MNNDWIHISEWKETGVLTEVMLEKWAYSENAYFSTQDEDLLMYRPQLIKKMHQLMLDKNSFRKSDLLKILKNYSTYVFERIPDKNTQINYEEIIKMELKSELHLKLVKHIICLMNSKKSS